MTARMTKQIFAAGALALALAMPAAYAQDAPPAPPVNAVPAPAPAATPDAPVTPAPEMTTSTTPPATTTKKRTRFRIGPEVGVYLPTSAKTRGQFGSAWYTLGLGLGNISTITTKGQTTFDLQILYQKKGDNHVFLAPVGIGYRQAFGQGGGPTVAYYGVTGDLILADLRSGDYDVHSGIRVGAGASALLGVNFGDSGYLEARYLAVTSIKSFDLSGLNLTAGYRF